MIPSVVAAGIFGIALVVQLVFVELLKRQQKKRPLVFAFIPQLAAYIVVMFLTAASIAAFTVCA